MRPLPQPHEVRAAIALRLLAEPYLLGLLAENPPWNRPDDVPDRRNSIVPMRAIELMKPMYVGIMAGPFTKNDRVSFDNFIYMRVYDSPDRDYIGIEKACGLIATALDRTRLTMANTVAAQVDLEQILAEAEDEALKQNYRELQFKLVLL